MRLIDADALKEFLKPHDMWKNNRTYLTWEEIWEQECEDIDAQPTVDVDPVKHGRWISDEDGNISCSVCGQHGVGDNYCEKCGAKMEVEE